MIRKLGKSLSLLQTLDDALEKLLKWAWRNRKMLAAGLAVLVAAYAVGAPDEEVPPEDPQVVTASAEPAHGALFDRLWVDHVPKNHKDSFRMYFFLKRHPVGVHLIFHSMTYRTQEFFQHQVKGKEIRFHFHNPNVKPKTKAKFEGVKGHKHFDMKMTLERDPQAKGVSYTYHRLKPEKAEQLLAAYGVTEASLAASLGAR